MFDLFSAEEKIKKVQILSCIEKCRDNNNYIPNLEMKKL